MLNAWKPHAGLSCFLGIKEIPRSTDVSSVIQQWPLWSVCFVLGRHGARFFSGLQQDEMGVVINIVGDFGTW